MASPSGILTFYPYGVVAFLFFEFYPDGALAHRRGAVRGPHRRGRYWSLSTGYRFPGKSPRQRIDVPPDKLPYGSSVFLSIIYPLDNKLYANPVRLQVLIGLHCDCVLSGPLSLADWDRGGWPSDQLPNGLPKCERGKCGRASGAASTLRAPVLPCGAFNIAHIPHG